MTYDINTLTELLRPYVRCDGLGCGGSPDDTQDRDFCVDPAKLAAKIIACSKPQLRPPKGTT
jgi:hypothetical protein